MKHEFQVTGMTCGHCERAVTRAIQELDPQALIKIERSQNRVEVESNQTPELLKRAIAEQGYAVAP